MCLSPPAAKYTRSQVDARPDQDWVIVEDKIYNAKEFRDKHPGGPVFVSLFGGGDATMAFQSYHLRRFPHDKMREYCVGSLVDEPVAMDDAHLELSKKIRPLVGRAPFEQFAKAYVLLGVAFLIELRLYFVTSPALALVLGLVFALIGLNVQHDANHGATRSLGWTQNWIGGSQLLWLQEHVVLHHLHTCTDMDPDAQMDPVMRGHERAWRSWFHRFQGYYFLALELFYGVVPVFVSFVEALMWAHKGHPISRLAKTYRPAQILWHLSYYVRMYFMGPQFVLTMLVGGFYLAFFFFLSHNFDGVQYRHPLSFLQQQVEASSNVGGQNLCFINGGLNYQIEHHLFPRVPHTYYPRIAPVVKAFVQARGCNYVHFDTVAGNLASVFTRLSKLGVAPKLQD